MKMQPKVAISTHIPGSALAQMRVMAENVREAVIAQLVEDAILVLGPQAFAESKTVIARRLDMIFDELVARRMRRNSALARIATDGTAPALREAILVDVYARLVAADTESGP